MQTKLLQLQQRIAELDALGLFHAWCVHPITPMSLHVPEVHVRRYIVRHSELLTR